MVIDFNKKNDFYKFIYKEIGEKIKCKTTKNLEISCNYVILKREEEDKIKELISRYNLENFNIVDNIKNYIDNLDDELEEFKYVEDIDKYFMLNYLEQYNKEDSVQVNKYKNLYNELNDIAEYYSIGDFPYNSKDFNYIRLDECISYYILDEVNSGFAKDIIERLTSKKVEFAHINIINKEYQINGLVYFCIHSNYCLNKESFLQRELPKILAENGISNFVYVDKNGELKILLEEQHLRAYSGLEFKEDLGGAFRTSWEADFARILNYLDISWSYRQKHFEIAEGMYTPSFLLNNNILVDLNEYWNSDKTKVKSFRERYKDYKLYTIDSDMMVTLKKMFCEKVNKWESRRIYSRSEILPLVGMKYLEDTTIVDDLKIGDLVYLKRDKNNKYDVNAVKVFNKDGKLLGFISAYWSPIFADKIDVGMEYNGEVKSKEEELFRIKIKRSNLEEDIIYDFLKK